MKFCPICSRELDVGFARTGQRIAWKKHEYYGFNTAEKDEGEFYLRGSALNGSSCPGYYCPACDLILLPQKEDETT